MSQLITKHNLTDTKWNRMITDFGYDINTICVWERISGHI